MDPIPAAETFPHIRIVMGMVVSLSIARLLNGLAGIVQHPKEARLYLTHLGWVAFMMLFLVHFWWWEYRLHEAPVIGFGAFLFLILFCSLFFFLCALLFPTSMKDYDGYEHYFFSRRKWFFGLFAGLLATDILDTILKGRSYFASLGWEYPLRTGLYIVLALIAAYTASRRYHAAFVVFALAYQFYWIWRIYDILT
ncbi:hypothetical protein [Rhizobium sp. LC145]|uniref:hypothetical protein n=1 Tax=Rhizobium sp. LC145 TaxID=1120688 RepID=UPI00062A076B|nr:hypothetical protein [Rhizobium sp. LC145]KKX33940.1 membrane protein [Rhizobium sp. LC145]TKT44250.1 hypothetical protein FDR95_26145 [Rhizobiaceae bacterium LC148]